MTQSMPEKPWALGIRRGWCAGWTEQRKKGTLKNTSKASAKRAVLAPCAGTPRDMLTRWRLLVPQWTNNLHQQLCTSNWRLLTFLLATKYL